VATIDNLLVSQALMIDYFPFIESVMQNTLDCFPCERFAFAIPVAQAIQVIGNFMH
jgi:hypothetical protein